MDSMDSVDILHDVEWHLEEKKIQIGGVFGTSRQAITKAGLLARLLSVASQSTQWTPLMADMSLVFSYNCF